MLRTYLVRHGPGPFPTQDASLASLPEPHNADGPWQGPVRAGWPDWVLLKYALAACHGADGLAVTHLDVLDARARWQAAVGYNPPLAVEPSFGKDLARQEALTKSLFRCEPVYSELKLGREPREDFLAALEQACGIPVRFASRGPTADDVRERAAAARP